MKITRSLFGVLLLTSALYGQQDFNSFKNLRASGDIPSDFTARTFRQIDADMQNNEVDLKASKEKIFLEGVHYAINDLLHSGVVIYGDEVTMYVTSVAEKLLAKEEVLQKKLRFYTIKSNETNAFSTYQGIIFVTTGLISQLSNEAELAYVLSHEIAHYTEEHVVETFDYKVNSKRSKDQIQALSKFSKENEFEADKLGIRLYNQAGYSKDQLMSTFDVLLYSYLPFEELEYPKNHLNNSLITIPEGFYPNRKFEITATEDADDSKSSHPNIKKRKEAVEKELENYKDWGNHVYIFGKDKFEYIRNLCRFESIRTDIVDAEFDDALYSIFVLEKQFPKSIYLQRMKAKAWLGYAQYAAKGNIKKKLPAVKEMEGEIASLQYLLRELNKNQALVVSMRMIEDIKKQNPDDKVIQGIWERMVKTLAAFEKFDLEKYSGKTYEVAYQEIMSVRKDTVQTKADTSTVNLSKYDKIKKQNSTSSETVIIDSSQFYLYALSDLKSQKNFLDQYGKYKEEIAQKEKEREEYQKLSPKQRKKFDKRKEKEREQEGQGINSMVYLEPLVFSFTKKGVDRVKSEKLQIDYTNSILNIAADFNMNVSVLGRSNLDTKGTEAFNQRSVLMSYFSELVENEDIEVFPTDYDELLEIKSIYNTDKLVLSVLNHERNYDVRPGLLIVSIIFYPVSFAYVPAILVNANKVEFSYLVIDISKGELVKSENITSKESINKHTINARVYNFLKQIK